MYTTDHLLKQKAVVLEAFAFSLLLYLLQALDLNHPEPQSVNPNPNPPGTRYLLYWALGALVPSIVGTWRVRARLKPSTLNPFSAGLGIGTHGDRLQAPPILDKTHSRDPAIQDSGVGVCRLWFSEFTV